jgi:hypothetical protein
MRRNVLSDRLLASDYAPLVEMIDWEATPRRSLTRVYGMALLAGFCCAITLIGVASVASMSTPIGPVLSGLLVFVVGGNIITSIVRGARRELSKFPETALFGAKAPVLYLREFKTENPDFAQDSLASGAGWLLAVSIVLTPFAAFILSGGRSDRSFENLLTKALGRVGPLVCLGDPHRRRKIGEARRLPIKSPVWQDAVTFLLQRSSFIVLNYSPGASLDWEAVHVIHGTRKPVLLWIPHQLSGDSSRSGEDFFATLPEWLRTALRADGVSAFTFDRADQDYLILFTEHRHVCCRPVKATWSGLRQGIKELLVEGAVVSSKGMNNRPAVTAPIEFARGLVSFPLLLGMFLCLLVVAPYMMWLYRDVLFGLPSPYAVENP